MIREKRKQAFKSLYVGMAMLAVALVAFRIRPIMILSTLIGIAAFAYYVYLSFTYWKCPACGQQFPIVYSRMDERTECWYCLASIEEPAEGTTQDSGPGADPDPH